MGTTQTVRERSRNISRRLEGHNQLWMIVPDELTLLAAVEQLKAQPPPVRREPWGSGDALVRQAQAAKAKYGCQPYRSGRRAVDAVPSVEAQIVEVQHAACI